MGDSGGKYARDIEIASLPVRMKPYDLSLPHAACLQGADVGYLQSGTSLLPEAPEGVSPTRSALTTRFCSNSLQVVRIASECFSLIRFAYSAEVI